MAITQEFWDQLSEKAQWDIKVALRGPDSYYGETLKWFTTSVIRGTCRKIFRVGGTINQDLKLIILPQDLGSQGYTSKTSWNASHFIEHVGLAAEWLKIPILYIQSQLWHEVMSSKNTREAARLIIEWLDQQAAKETEKPKPKYALSSEGEKKKRTELYRHFIKQLGGHSATSQPDEE